MAFEKYPWKNYLNSNKEYSLLMAIDRQFGVFGCLLKKWMVCQLQMRELKWKRPDSVGMTVDNHYFLARQALF